MKIIGIYKITSPSGRIYIGQSRNIIKRFKRYFTLDCKKQPRLYRSLNKYGYDRHTFEIIEECDFDKLNIRERYYQDLYDVLSRKGMNCILTKTDILPKVMHYNTKIKNLKSLPKGINHHYSKKVINIITLKIYNSLSECCKDNNLNPKYMSRILSGSRKNKTDYLYFKENGNYFSEIRYKSIPKIKIKKSIEEIHHNRSNAKKGIKNGMYGKKGILNSKSKQVLDIETGFIYNSLSECCIINNLNSKYMSRWLNNSRPNKTKYKYIVNE